MTMQALHFRRYMESQEVDIDGGGTDLLATGWHHIFDVIQYVYDQFAIELYYDGATNRVKQNGVHTLSFSAAAAALLGFPALSAVAEGDRPPGSTWAPQEVGFKYSWDPTDSQGAEPVYDCVTQVSLDGTVWALGSNAIQEEAFHYSLVESEIVIDTAATSDFTATWRDVWRPDLGVHFIWRNSATLAGLSTTLAQIAAAWEWREYKIKDCEAVQQSMAIQFDDYSAFRKFDLPLIYVGTGVPV